MDFTPRTETPAPNTNHSAHLPTNRAKAKRTARIIRWSTLVLLFSVSILVIAVAASFAFGGGNNHESKLVKKSQLQAVFLNGGQVYFGNVASVNANYMTLRNVYYLRVGNQNLQSSKSDAKTNNDVSLVKLGCELHGPEDQLVINQTQVVFWENLKTDGQVAKAVAQFQKANPNGQDCAAQNATSSTTPAATDSTTKQ